MSKFKKNDILIYNFDKFLNTATKIYCIFEVNSYSCGCRVLKRDKNNNFIHTYETFFILKERLNNYRKVNELEMILYA